jgi:hypothetical protein
MFETWLAVKALANKHIAGCNTKLQQQQQQRKQKFQ